MAENIYPKSFAQAMEELYGREGALQKLESIKRRQQKRPDIVKAAGLPVMDTTRVGDSLQVTYTDVPFGRGGGKPYPRGAYTETTVPFGAGSVGASSARVLATEPGFEGKALPFIGSDPGPLMPSEYIDKSLPLGKPPDDYSRRGAWIPAQENVALHEQTHYVYPKAPRFFSADVVEDLKKAMPDVRGDVRKELPAYLAEIVRWGASRDEPTEKMLDKDYRLGRPPGNMSTTPKEAEETLDSFREMLKKRRSWGFWDEKKLDNFMKDKRLKKLLINYMPELAKTDQDEYATV